MIADLIEKARNIDELMAFTKKIKVEKVIEIDVDVFKSFEQFLLLDYDFIKDNVDFMYVDKNEVWHCIFITYSGSDYGILVESEGYHYARYSAYKELNEEIENAKWEKYPQYEKYDSNKNIPF
jgi:hypothetical protein